MEALHTTPLASLLSTYHPRLYPKGQIVIYPDDQPSDVFILADGEIKLYDIDDNGNEKILHILRPPAIFPLSFHFAAIQEVVWFYSALTDACIYRLPFLDMQAHISKDPTLAVYIMERTGLEMHELLVRIDSMGKTTTQAKLIAALKFLAVHHATIKRSAWRCVKFPVNHQLLADMTGVTRESITMTIQDLQQAKVVRYPKLTMLEINFDKLVNL